MYNNWNMIKPRWRKLADKYIVNGGNPLRGDIQISGSKNAALGIIAAAMLLDDSCIIENLPHIEDIRIY